MSGVSYGNKGGSRDEPPLQAMGLKRNPGLCGENIAWDLITGIHDDTIGMFVFADGLTADFDRF